MNANDSLELEKLQKDKKKAGRKGHLKEVSNLCNFIGQLLAKNGLYQEAITEHKEELALSEAHEDRMGSAIACRKIGECYSEQGYFEKAFVHLNRYLESAKACNDVLEEQRAWATLGRTLLLQSDSAKNQLNSNEASKKAEKAFLKGLEVCERLKSTLKTTEYMQMKSRLQLNLGLVYEGRGDMKNSTDCIKQAIDKTQKFGLYDDLYRCQFTLSSMYQKHGNLSQAIRQMEEGQRAAKQLKDKQLESEALSQKALLFTQLGDYSSARRSLKLANKLGDATVPIQHQIRKTYNAVVQMEELTDDLETIAPDNDAERGMVYEKLGDIAASIDLYKPAIEFYQKLLSCAEKEERDSAGMIPVYVSLASTYADDKQYSRAIDYYLRELQCQQNNHEQCCRTLLNIAEAQESINLDYDTIKKTYVSAFENARKSKHRKLQVQCLISLIQLQRTHNHLNHQRQTEAKLEAIQRKYNISEEEEEEEESQEVETQETPDRQISDLSESDEEYGTQSIAPNNSRGVGKRFTALSTKRNEKGETPLHRACIEGNLRKVKTLVEQGHPINPRDFCGWLPLHEAANHDHPDIVAYLISHGAWLNDRGGEHCGGVTPLLDAANCGNLDTMKILIEQEANVLAKDDEGSTVLECLESWRNRTEDTLSSEDREKCVRMEKLLLNKTGMVAKSNVGSRRRRTSSPVNRHEDEELTSLSPLPRTIKERKPSQKNRFELNSEDDEDSDCDSETFFKNVDEEKSRSATDYYKRAMTAVGSSADRIHSQLTNQNTSNNPISKSTNERAALIDADSNIGDSWLIEDVKVQGSKRKRSEVNKLLLPSLRSTTDSNQSRKRQKYADLPVDVENVQQEVLEDAEDAPEELTTIAISDDNSNDSVEIEVPLSQESRRSSHLRSAPLGRKQSGRLQKSRQLKLTNLLSRSNDNIATVVNDNNLRGQPVESAARSATNPAGEGGSFISHALPAAMKIKIRVTDRLLLIPVTTSETSQTISWLAEETSQRYYNLYGLRPIIQLSTRDGAVLSPDDLISLVVSSEEELIGEVENWEVPPLQKRYDQACQALKTLVYRNIRTCLQQCNETGKLCLTGLALQPSHFQPIVRALQRQYNLKELHLPENQLGDSGVRSLSQILHELPNLSTLDLSGNQVTADGLNTLTESINKALHKTAIQNKPFQMMRSINLSQNPLGDGCIMGLLSLFKLLPLIEHLQLARCSLTQNLFQNHRILLTTTLKGCDLRQALLSIGSDSTNLSLGRFPNLMVHAMQCEPLHQRPTDSSLRTLDVSYNMLGSTGVELLLWCLRPGQMTGLALRATVLSRTSNHITKYIHNYTVKEVGCVLETLDLSDCQLSGEDLLQLLRLLEPRLTLRHLMLNNNKGLKNDAFREIVKTSYDLNSVLEKLEMRGCGITSPLSSELIDSLSDKLNGDYPLTCLVFSCNNLDKIDRDSIEQVWTERWKEEALCNLQGNQLHISVQNNILTV